MSGYHRLVDVKELRVRYPLLTVYSEPPESGGSDATHDVGFVSPYWDGTNTRHYGLFRDVSDGFWQGFSGLLDPPDVVNGTVNILGSGYTVDSWKTNNLSVLGNATVSGDLTVNGVLTAINSNTLEIDDNIIVSNAGPLGQKEDGGFVVRRQPSSITTDTAKEGPITIGGAAALSTTTFGTTDTLVGQAVADYYEGWYIKFSGATTTVALQNQSYRISAYAVTNKTFTTSAAMAAAPVSGDVFSLYNGQYTGLIWDESTDYLTMYKFPREDQENSITINDANGNVADYANFRASVGDFISNVNIGGALSVVGNATFSSNVTITGALNAPKIDDNIFTINTGPTNQLSDGGYVLERTAADATSVTPKESGIVVGGAFAHSPTAVGTASTLVGQSTANYYAGWYIKFRSNTTTAALQSQVALVTSYAVTNKVFTLASTLPDTPVNGDVFDLYNTRYIGLIYTSADKYLNLFTMPREEKETDISTTDADGNVADLVDLKVNNLSIAGTITATGVLTKKTFTQVASVTFTPTQMKTYDVIYLNPAADGNVYTLPTILSLSLAANTAIAVTFVSLASFKLTVATSGLDDIEGDATVKFKFRGTIFTLLAAPGQTRWNIL
jgi:hypothetical protein